MHLRGVHQDALDLADGSDLTDEDHARRGIAARARARQQAEDVSGRVPHERQRARSELRRDQLAGPARFHRLAASPDRETRRRGRRMQVHALVHPALAGERPDLCLAAVVEELDPEGVLELAAQRRGQRLGGREADAVRQVPPRIEAELARGVAEVGEEARRAGVDRRSPRPRQLDLEPAVAGAAVQDEAARLLEGAVEPEPSRHDVVGEGHVRDVAGAHAHGTDRRRQHRRPAALGGETRDQDRPRRRVQRAELRPRHGEELAEGRMRALVLHQVGLRGARDTATEIVVGADVRDVAACPGEQPPIVRRMLHDPAQGLCEAGHIVGAGRPVHAAAIQGGSNAAPPGSSPRRGS